MLCFVHLGLLSGHGVLYLLTLMQLKAGDEGAAGGDGPAGPGEHPGKAAGTARRVVCRALVGFVVRQSPVKCAVLDVTDLAIFWFVLGWFPVKYAALATTDFALFWFVLRQVPVKCTVLTRGEEGLVDRAVLGAAAVFELSAIFEVVAVFGGVD